VPPQARDLPFNRYAWLTTHTTRSRGWGSARRPAWNQQDTVTDQLNVSSLARPPRSSFRKQGGLLPLISPTPPAVGPAAGMLLLLPRF
jgi:hypothetical protein